MANWLRPACAMLKRSTNNLDWQEKVPERILQMAKELNRKVMANDPVRGKWNVKKTNCGDVWCDVSSLANGVVLQIDGITVEDG